MAITLAHKIITPSQFNNGRTFSFTVPDVDHRLLLMGSFSFSPNAGMTTRTYNGVVMTQQITQANFGGLTCRAYFHYLLDPPVGAHDIVTGWAVNCTNWNIPMLWQGVDLDNPFGTPVQNLANDALITVNVSSEADEVVVDACAEINNPGRTLVMGALQTLVAQGQGPAPVVAYAGCSYETGLPTNTMSWTLSGNANWATVAVPLKPVVAIATRPIEYTLDVWDPEQRILDSRGHVVPRYKIKPNRWCRIVGLESTIARVYTSNYEDPTLVYFESVTYDGETDEVQIITNRGDLPEVIMARLASGSTG